MNKIIWSSYQKAIFNNIANDTGHLIVVARAGSSKTTSLIEALKYLPKNKKTLMVAFNKSIAQELKNRASSYIDCFTLHSLGYRAVRNHFGKDVVLDPNKAKKIISEFLQKEYGQVPHWDLLYSFDRAVWLAKASLSDSPSKLEELIDQYGIDICDFERDEFVKVVLKVLRLCKENTKYVDYNDMVWFPFVYNLDIGKWDYVFVDEAQDLTDVQVALALSACKKGGRIIVFGDNMQHLYGFAGVDSNSIFTIQKQLDAKILLLPITYRCPKKVVKLAQEIVPDFQEAPNAKNGSIFNIQEDKLIKCVRPGDVVLSRTNAPLIKYCLAAIKNNIPANIKGRDIAAGLIYLLKSSKKQKIDTFLKWLDEWQDKEVARLLEKKRDTTVLKDKVECLINLCDGCDQVSEAIDKINKMFNDKEEDIVVFSSIHKFKGMENDRVFILNWTLKNTTQEEIRIRYVAITRTKNELYFVHK